MGSVAARVALYQTAGRDCKIASFGVNANLACHLPVVETGRGSATFQSELGNEIYEVHIFELRIKEFNK